MRTNRVFQFLRGAVRSAYGEENFRNKTLLIVGMSRNGQELLNRLCINGVNIKFQDPKVSNYRRSFAVCRDVDIYEGEKADIIIDFPNRYLNVKGKTFPLDKIGDNPYTQGIHEYYL
jgi:hypothetical protein